MFADIREFVALDQYRGTFEFPKINDCSTPGECHSSWKEGQYIDNMASVTTNWDNIGTGAGEGTDNIYLHFDSMASDSWKAGSAPNPSVFW
ncbi:hypothetical protein GUITHDRAFT_104964 [Guillardia theta CCMP2712]|uniref:Uncharacterized protein n=1 Tax=Guillardia theta (strain CCMP2712) TaxID=905079 RepID=L1JMK8_GUITC|nr:hypothetical protein GUITHDRAFT_104964 [Guillardia theta CCMP2712]EKX49435.1 hypothetical protein GUITHDRAFT_104964 [Guillardia theta CCMP2712]|eukprot:XP_005836415.1 hypothetical protein GUITHDRAFT_104964 [Guillardia theta CCMP2712]